MVPANLALPKGESVHEGLKFKFVDLPNLISHLAESNFSGYLALSAGERRGLALMHRGILSDAFVSNKGMTESGEPALAQLFLMPRDKEGQVSARKLNENFIASYSSLAHGKDTYSNLSGGITNFQGLMATLVATKFSGSIQIESRANQGFVFFQNGTSLGGFYPQSDLLLEDMPRVEEIAAESGATLSVFASKNETTPALRMPHLTTHGEVKLLSRVLESVLNALVPLAGPKVQEYFSTALAAISAPHPWLADLRISSSGSVNFDALDPTGITLDDAIQGFLVLMNRCLEQGYNLFGDKIIQATVQKDLESFRAELDTLGFPNTWPQVLNQ